jgi:S1-C subfamily serine protease
MQKKNVVATGIGFKVVGGKETSDLSIICSVGVKMPKAKLDKRDIIPEGINRFPTDVRPSGIIRAFQNQSPTGRFRPAPGGCSIGQFQITAGTLGCLVKKNNSVYILSNNHVLANSNEASNGDSILQPGPHDGGKNPADVIGSLTDFIPISFEEEEAIPTCPIGRPVVSFLNQIASMTGSTMRFRAYRIQQTENKVDCALAQPVKVDDVKNEILLIGKISGTEEGQLGMRIKKSGRTTGLTNGTIEQIDVSARVSYGTNKTALFTDQLLAGAMSQGGDSGSAVVNDNNNLVGLLFAGSESTTIINRVGNVFQSLGVTLV